MKMLRELENIKESIREKIDLTDPAVGMNGRYMPESVPKLDRAPTSVVVKNDHNALTIYGKDRPGTLSSGYGGSGCSQCASVDTVVGLQSMAPNGPDGQTLVNPNMMYDAGRILLSQMSDVDSNFGIVAGTIGDATAQSAAALKADAVRLIGRSGGIKIVTGTDPMSSQGVKIFSTPGIELNAGNDDGSRRILGLKDQVNSLQPIPKGENLILYLEALSARVDELGANFSEFMKTQTKYNNLVSSHVHIAAAPGAPTTPAIELMVGTPLVNIVNTAFSKIPNYFNRINITTSNVNYLKNIGPVNILSRYNRTT